MTKETLINHVVVITGASGDLGTALARRLVHEEKAKVWLTDIDESALGALERELLSAGGVVVARKVDVRDDTAMFALAKEVFSHEKRLDVWINNAGLPPSLGSFETMPRDTFEKIMDVNFQGVVRGTRAALSVMTNDGRGKIINIASVAGLVPAPYMSAYCSAKHAVIGFSRALQTELTLEDSPVHVKVAVPGFLQSKMIDDHPSIKFPDWMRWALGNVETTARQIIDLIQSDQHEAILCANGKFMNMMHAMFPQWTRRSTKLLLARRLQDILWNRYQL